mmetsp:Transcript_27480/g.80196  ORF Transcript_27480/g.80196 Transcript_27480/m.80196 type:complete len:214 (+) Transcript_27480:1108-1749(+)
MLLSVKWSCSRHGSHANRSTWRQVESPTLERSRCRSRRNCWTGGKLVGSFSTAAHVWASFLSSAWGPERSSPADAVPPLRTSSMSLRSLYARDSASRAGRDFSSKATWAQLVMPQELSTRTVRLVKASASSPVPRVGMNIRFPLMRSVVRSGSCCPSLASSCQSARRFPWRSNSQRFGTTVPASSPAMPTMSSRHVTRSSIPVCCRARILSSP